MFRKIAVLALSGVSSMAYGADNGLYVGVGASQSKFSVDLALDDKDTGYKGLIGFRALDSFGIEANYHDHGTTTIPTGIACIALVGVPCPATVSLDARTTSAFAVGFLAKAGIANVKATGRAAGITLFNYNDSSTEFAWGGGLQAHFGSLGARAEYEQFKLPFGEKLDAFSVSFVYTFL
jgi:Outer membrane protein beta-barrel domain